MYLPYKCPKTTARSLCNVLMLYCKAAKGMTTAVNHTIATCHEVNIRRLSLTCASLATLYDHLAAALHVTRDNVHHAAALCSVGYVQKCLQSALWSPRPVASGEIAQTVVRLM